MHPGPPGYSPGKEKPKGRLSRGPQPQWKDKGEDEQMEFNSAEYIDLLNEEFPKFSFNINKTEQYRKNEGDIYTVDIIDSDGEEFPSFSMIVGYFDFTEEQQKENFKRVAELTINARTKELEAEQEKQKAS